MSNPIAALEADRAALLEICSGLDDQDWTAQSGCEGWSVKDIVAHLGASFWLTVDPSMLPDASGLPTEQAQEVYVQARRSLTPSEVVSDYASVSEKALVALGRFLGTDFEMALGDLGTYPGSALPAAYCFDHYTHIRADLFVPRGPLRGPIPPSDELRLLPTLDWIEAALPQQNSSLVADLAGPIEIVIIGDAGRNIRLGHDGRVTATVRSGADACVRWITQRATWEDLGVQVSGDEQILTDARRLKVF
jgi:uncharacterized protein (TIGR03083 family)